jgi:hypothetical protein
MFETLTLEFTGQLATLTLNRPEKRNAINSRMVSELQSALDEIESGRSRVGIITGAGKAFCAGMDLEMLSDIANQSSNENMEDSRRLRHRHAVRLHAVRSGSEIRLHRSKNRIPPGDCFRLSHAANRRQAGTQFALNWAPHRSARSLEPRAHHRNRAARASNAASARTRRCPDRRKPCQPNARKAPADVRRSGQRGSRSGARHSRECAYPLHRGFQGRARFVSRKTQTRLEHGRGIIPPSSASLHRT